MSADPRSAAGQPKLTLSRRWRAAIGVLVIGHLWAMIGRPIEFATRGPTGPSPSATTFYAPVRGYSELTYMNHGYAFFAPDPGPSHLITAELPRNEGGTARLTFPDLQNQWPRLLYHRHFMLTEFLHNVYQPPLPPELAATDPPAAAAWQADRQRYEAVRDSMRGHLAHAMGLDALDQVQIQRVEHRMPGLPEFLDQRMRLRDPRLYRVLADEPFSVPADSDLQRPTPEPVPQGTPAEEVGADASGQQASDERARREAALP